MMSWLRSRWRLVARRAAPVMVTMALPLPKSRIFGAGNFFGQLHRPRRQATA
ncbi:hypothetical protein [Xylella fastidiosa]|uniref:hypothetical protein n=1 Tax=Xylella fastidiosa TaxID=2371 RepID=UPI002416773D|nr:hypothetical protein [Xylella fastidiosa]